MPPLRDRIGERFSTTSLRSNTIAPSRFSQIRPFHSGDYAFWRVAIVLQVLSSCSCFTIHSWTPKALFHSTMNWKDIWLNMSALRQVKRSIVLLVPLFLHLRG